MHPPSGSTTDPVSQSDRGAARYAGSKRSQRRKATLLLEALLSHTDFVSAQIGPDARSFLAEGQRIGNLATVRKNGNPWLQPLWYSLRENRIIIVPTARSLTTRNLRRTGRAALSVNDEALPYRFATLECVANVQDSEDLVRDYLAELVAKYRPTIDPTKEIDLYMKLGCVGVNLHMERVVFMPEVVELRDGEK